MLSLHGTCEIKQVGLVDKINTRVGALSGGMRRKLSLGIALIGNSKVLKFLTVSMLAFYIVSV